MNTTIAIIVFGAIFTYLSRAGGHVVLSRFEHIHPRVEAALNAVPAAVLTTLVAPAVLEGRPIEWIALAIAGLVATRAGMLAMFLSGTATLVILRHFFA